MRRSASRSACVALAAVAAGAANAQTCHSLSGAWRLDRSESLMGSGLSFDPTYMVSAIALYLDQRPDGSVSERWVLSGPHLQETDAFTVQPDGVARPTGLTSRLDTTPQTVQGRWLNCTLIVKAGTHLFGQALSTQNTYLLDPNGKRLTLVQTAHSDLGDVERRLVFKSAGG